MRAGRLDRVVTLQRKTETKSVSGAVTEAWTTLIARRAAGLWTPRSGSESFSDPQLVARERVEWIVRYSAALAEGDDRLSARDRLVYPALAGVSPDEEPDERDIYDIVGVFEAHELGRRVGLRIVTARRADVAA